METTVNELARKISKLNQIEKDELIDVLTNKYGIHADIYQYPAGIMPVSNENITFDVRLTNVGVQKLAVLKRITEILMLGLKEAKDIIDSAPCILIENISLEQAEDIQIDIENYGATIDII